MSQILYLESVAGIAGDMFAASFIDANLVSESEIKALPELLGLEGVEICINKLIKATIQATNLQIQWNSNSWKKAFGKTHQHEQKNSPENTNLLLDESDKKTHFHTHFAEIETLISNSKLDENVKNLSKKIFHLLAEVEAQAHGIELAKVAFHELGTIDSILDVVMAAFCVCKINASKIYASPIKVGRGLIKIAHGFHAVPPPASTRLLVNMNIASTPKEIILENIELSTPTGIAILKAIEPTFVGELPSGKMLANGMGAGTKDLGNYPNVFRVSLIEESQSQISLPYKGDEIYEIVCNIDDETAEKIAWLTQQLLQMNALDVWLTPIYGKKGRPATMLTFLADDENWQVLANWILQNSSTFGVRYQKWNRLKLERHFETRETSNGKITYKIGSDTNGNAIKEKPEYEEISKTW